MRPGHFLLFAGPYGAGKSTSLRHALREEGAGLVLLAPGDDERASYSEFEDKPGYDIRSFDDPLYMPSLGSEYRKTEGYGKALATLAKAVEVVRKDAEEGKPLRWPVIAVDTVSSFATLTENNLQASMGLEGPPSDKEGIIEYSTRFKKKMEELIRPMRALRGYGAHLLMTTHVSEKPGKSTGLAVEADAATGVELRSKTSHAPLIYGAFRDVLLGYPDVIFHCRVRAGGKTQGDYNDPEAPRFVVQWQSSPERLTKSRLGALTQAGADGRMPSLPNEWRRIKPALDAALDRRAGGVS